MANRTYKYPFGGWLGRALLWLFFTLLIFTLLFDVPGAIDNLFAAKATQWDIIRLVLAVVLGAIFWSYTTNAYPNIEETDQGLRVEFFWTSLFIPWENIVQVKANGRAGTNWSVQAKGLSPLHYLYGLFFTWRFVPVFVIFTYLSDYQKLLKSIEQKARLQIVK